MLLLPLAAGASPTYADAQAGSLLLGFAEFHMCCELVALHCCASLALHKPRKPRMCVIAKSPVATSGCWFFVPLCAMLCAGEAM